MKTIETGMLKGLDEAIAIEIERIYQKGYDAEESMLHIALFVSNLKVQSAFGEQGKWVSVEIIGIIQEMDWNNDGEVNAQNLIKKIREYKYLPPPPNQM